MQRLDLILSVMTPIQRRRWRLYLRGKSLREIANEERKSHVAVLKSLRAGKKRAEKRLGWVTKGLPFAL